ncbi:hypothetical protein ACFOMD_03460 [Sphingoaurantiacus capsulatus]|uniref:Flap endonuclease-1-like 5' DNA nuclease n=1 Tax=Sphingoaurantiacus capsulatus TaxID=1771310 RepID=A0ABV7X8R9_9SPHN
MNLSLAPDQVAIIIWALVGLLVGLLLSRMGPSRRRLALSQADVARLKAEIDARDARITQLERDVAASRDQVRPLSDEVDRLRRESAKRSAAPAAVVAPPIGSGVASEVIAPTAAPSGAPDNLTLMKGVGDRFAAKLNEIGVFHYRQIAEWSPADVAAADARLDKFSGRIERDQLVEQAKLLAEGRTTEYEARFGKIGGDAPLS